VAFLRQVSFAGGELAPALWGRTDLPIRSVALRRCYNFFPERHGALHSRPGTQYIGKAKVATTVRLLPFIYSDSQTYVLEFSAGYIRFWTAGGFVETVPGNGIPYEVVNPYLAGDLVKLRWAQSGDVLTLTCAGYPAKELKRLANNSWTLTDVVFDRPVLLRNDNGSVGSYVFFGTPSAGTATEPAREWKYMVTKLIPQSDGGFIESAPVLINQQVNGGVYTAMPDKFAVYQDLPATLQMYPSGSLLAAPLRHRVYRGRAAIDGTSGAAVTTGLFGWVGDTDTWSFTDTGNAPDYERQPPKGTNPFKVYDYTVSPPTLTRTEYPRAVGFFEDRRVFAGTDQRPDTVWMSRTGDYANFDEHVLPLSDDAVELALAARRRQDVRHLVGLQKLIVCTESSIWSVGGAGGGALGADDIPDAKQQIDVGASDFLPPLLLANTVLYARSREVGVRDLFYDLQKQSWDGSELTRHARHFFDGDDGTGFRWKLTDWCYQENPFGLVWALKTGGKLLSLTYDRDLGVMAWAQHQLGVSGATGDAGTVVSLCAVPEGAEDAVYLAVSRPTQGGVAQIYIERLMSRVPRLKADGTVDPKYMGALDCSLTYVGASVTSVSGLNHLEGSTGVYLVADGNVIGPKTVTAGAIDFAAELPEGATVVMAGLPFNAELELLDIAGGESRGLPKAVKRVFFEVANSRGFKTGPDFLHLTAWKQRQIADSYDAVSSATDLVQVNVPTRFGYGGRAVLRQDTPLFCTIVGVTREVDIGGA
jgi:hypothetical protein